MTAIAPAATFASSTPTATTSAAFAPAIDRLSPEPARFTRAGLGLLVETFPSFFETLFRGSCVRHGRLIHPRAAPDPPGCPPGRVIFLCCIILIGSGFPNEARVSFSAEVRTTALLHRDVANARTVHALQLSS